MSFEKHGRGEIARLLLHKHLIEEGYQVFIEDGTQGPIDLMAIHLETGEVRAFEVKTVSRRADGTRVNRILKPHQKILSEKLPFNIEVAYGDTENNSVEFPKKSS